jgi:hypothetical protein
MRTSILNATLAALAAITLAGCYAEVEAPSVQATQAMPPGGGSFPPAAPGSLSRISDALSKTVFPVDIGDQPFLKSSQSAGPATLHGSLVVNSATLTLVTPATGADFSGITNFAIWQVPVGLLPEPNCALAGSPCKQVAGYDKGRDGALADPKVLVLRGQGANLLDLLQNGVLDVQFTFSGNLPNQAWTGNLVLDMGADAKATFP